MSLNTQHAAHIKSLKRRFGKTKRLRLWRLLAQLLSSGIELREALPLSGRALNSYGVIYTEVTRELSDANGQGAFETRLLEFCDATERVLFTGIQGTPNIAEALTSAVDILNTQKRMDTAIRSAMIWPILYLIGIVIITVIYGLALGSAIEGITPPEDLGLSHKIMMGFSRAVLEDWIIYVPLSVASISFLVWSIKGARGSVRKALKGIPPWSLYELKSASMLAQCLVGLGKSGRDITAEQMITVEENCAPYDAQKVEGFRLALSHSSFADALKQNADFPDLFLNGPLS